MEKIADQVVAQRQAPRTDDIAVKKERRNDEYRASQQPGAQR